MTLQCHWFYFFRFFSGSKDSPGTCWQPRKVMEVLVSWESKSMNQTWCSFLNRFEIEKYFPSIINEFAQSICDGDHGFYQTNIHGEMCYYFRNALVSLCLGHWKGIFYVWLFGTSNKRHYYRYLWRVLWKHMILNVAKCQQPKQNSPTLLLSPPPYVY